MIKKSFASFGYSSGIVMPCAGTEENDGADEAALMAAEGKGRGLGGG